MNLLQAQSSGQVPLVNLTAPNVLGLPLSLGSLAQTPSQWEPSSPPGIGWLQRVLVTLRTVAGSLQEVEELAQCGG